MVSQENITLRLNSLKGKSLPRGLLVEPNVKGAHLLEQNLGIQFEDSPKEVVFGLRNRLIVFARIPDCVSPPKLYFLMGRRPQLTYGGYYHPDYHALLVWQEDRDCLEERYLHELVHAYCYQPHKALSKRERNDGDILEHSNDAVTFSSVTERRITTRFIAEGLAVWGASAILRRAFLSKQGVTDMDQEVKAHFTKIGLKSNSQNEWFEKIIPIALEKYQQALKFRGKTRSRRIEKADYYLQHFWYKQGHIFVRETLHYMINEGLSTREAMNILLNKCPQNFNQIQDPFELAEALIK